MSRGHGLEISSLSACVEVRIETWEATGCCLTVCSKRGEVIDSFVLALPAWPKPNAEETMRKFLGKKLTAAHALQTKVCERPMAHFAEI